MLFTFLEAFCGQIPVGLYTYHINVWRYWEKTNTGYKNKMIVFNTSDSILEFSLHQVIYLGTTMNVDTTKNNVFIKATKIDKYKYAIFDLPPSTEREEYMQFNVNHKSVGILGHNNIEPPKGLPNGRYSSNEGLNAKEITFWISKNNLITKNNQTDTIILHFNYFERPIYDKDGILFLIFKPYLNFRQFEVTLNGKNIGDFNVYNEYALEIPIYSEVDDKYKMEIMVIYKATKTKELSLGLSSSIGTSLLKEGQTKKELQRKLYPMPYLLPIVIN